MDGEFATSAAPDLAAVQARAGRQLPRSSPGLADAPGAGRVLSAAGGGAGAGGAAGAALPAVLAPGGELGFRIQCSAMQLLKASSIVAVPAPGCEV